MLAFHNDLDIAQAFLLSYGQLPNLLAHRFSVFGHLDKACMANVRLSTTKKTMKKIVFR